MFNIVRSWVDRFLSEEEAVLLVAILIGAALILLTMGDILVPLLMGIIFAYVLQGAIVTLERLRLPSALAVWCTFLLFLGGFLSLLFFVIPLAWRQMRALFENLPAMIEETRLLLATLPKNYPNLISEQQVGVWIDMLSTEAGDLGQWLVSFSLSQLPLVMTVVVYTMLVPIMVFFLLRDKQQLIDWCLSFLPERRPLLDRIGAEMNIQMYNYVRGKVIEILILGISSYVFFQLFGINYTVLLAFLVGLSVIIPYVGLVAVTFPVVIIAYLQFGWGVEFLYLVLGYGVLQAIDGLVIVPLLFSEANNLHPIAIILAVLIFGSWWGLWGVFFAIPLATLVKAVMTAWPQAQANKMPET
jgi:putative permease